MRILKIKESWYLSLGKGKSKHEFSSFEEAFERMTDIMVGQNSLYSLL